MSDTRTLRDEEIRTLWAQQDRAGAPMAKADDDDDDTDVTDAADDTDTTDVDTTDTTDDDGDDA